MVSLILKYSPGVRKLAIAETVTNGKRDNGGVLSQATLWGTFPEFLRVARARVGSYRIF